MRLLRARLCQKRIQFMRIRKRDTDLAEILTDLSGVLSLAVRDRLCQILQRILSRLKPVAEHVGRFTFPRGTYFYGGQKWNLFLHRKLLQCSSGVQTIMIGDSDQAKLLV